MLVCAGAEEVYEQLASRVLGALCDTWLLACWQERAFPQPSLWRTFAKLAEAWRHQKVLVLHWFRLLLLLTLQLQNVLYDLPLQADMLCAPLTRRTLIFLRVYYLYSSLTSLAFRNELQYEATRTSISGESSTSALTLL